jgi:hypothetical protein
LLQFSYVFFVSVPKGLHYVASVEESIEWKDDIILNDNILVFCLKSEKPLNMFTLGQMESDNTNRTTQSTYSLGLSQSGTMWSH